MPRVGLLSCCVGASHCGGFSYCGARALGFQASVVAAHWFSSFSAQVQLLRGTRDPPRSGIEPVSLALAGRSSTTGPSGVMLPAGFLQVFYWGFPGGSAGKEFTCDVGDLGSIPGLGRSPGEGRGSPLQYSGLENSMDYTVHRVAKSGTRLGNFHFHFIRLGKFLSVSNFLRANHGQSPLE